MKHILGSTHRAVGLATIVLFFATGQIMDRLCLDHTATDSAVRLLYGSRHIYLLFAGLLNLAVGMRFTLPPTGPGSRVAPAGSLMMLVSPVVLAFGFFLEPPRTGHFTILTLIGAFASYLGMFFYCLGMWKLRVA